MKIIFAKTKKARVICAILTLISLAVLIFAATYAVGNLLCASESPVLIGDNGGAFFLGYYLLASVYIALGLASAAACVIFFFNAIRR